MGKDLMKQETEHLGHKVINIANIYQLKTKFKLSIYTKPSLKNQQKSLLCVELWN